MFTNTHKHTQTHTHTYNHTEVLIKPYSDSVVYEKVLLVGLLMQRMPKKSWDVPLTKKCRLDI